MDCRRYPVAIGGSALGDENKNPEQIARDAIDARLSTSGWTVQYNRKIDLSAGPGVAVREYPTSIGPADYALFADRKSARSGGGETRQLGRLDHDGRGAIFRIRGSPVEMGMAVRVWRASPSRLTGAFVVRSIVSLEPTH